MDMQDALYSDMKNFRPEYPNPVLSREEGKWLNLNGNWKFDFDKNSVTESHKWYENHIYSQAINVPFPWESKLSGIEETKYFGTAWYSKELVLDDSWSNKQIMLKFGAVDWKCKIYVNGEFMKEHIGGYTPFEVDLTGKLKTNGETNNITVKTEDNGYSDYGSNQLFGKQGHDAPVGYTQSSGIWQTVYIEAYDCECYIINALANPDIDNQKVSFKVNINNKYKKNITADIVYGFESTLYDYKSGNTIKTGSDFCGDKTGINLIPGKNTIDITAAVPGQKLWDAETPNLYEGTFSLIIDGNISDKIKTHFGQRKIMSEKYGNNIYRYIHINHKPVFLAGFLDQGFWPDGIYTAPSDDALRQDIVEMKKLGFNLMRKHMKIEDPRQYYWADKIGMYIWQDMPSANTFDNPKVREIFEETLRETVIRNFNNPSIISYILFNESWGINHDNLEIDPWIARAYNIVKEINPAMPVEDMSPCRGDHVQPTDLFTFHMYPGSYNAAKNFMDTFNENLQIGNKHNFSEPYSYLGEPWLNSEFSGVSSEQGDLDVSWCFKYQTVIQRLYQALNGYVYTEMSDVEYEHNGIFNYDRSKKIFGYEDIAYGGDMDMKYLNQPNFIGFFNLPIVTIPKNGTYNAEVGAMNWSGDKFSGLTLKWRFDGTDKYGRYVDTGLKGEIPVVFEPYVLEKYSFSFTVPLISKLSRIVGVLTAWLEDDAENIIAKNFTNIIVTDGFESAKTQKTGFNSYVLRESAPIGTGNSLIIGYIVPSGMNLNALEKMRIITEVSAVKHGMSQTAQTEETPSDITISINGVEIDTVYIPDAPRDMRGTLTLKNNSSSAGNYGYLLDLPVPSSKIKLIKSAVSSSGMIITKYEIKNNAVNKNGINIYNETNGRYAVNPTVLLNPDDYIIPLLEIENDAVLMENTDGFTNGTISTLIEGEGGVMARVGNNKQGYYAWIDSVGDCVTLSRLDGKVIKAVPFTETNRVIQKITLQLFDAHIKVFTENNPEPVIDVYDNLYTKGSIGVKSFGKAVFRDITGTNETYWLTAKGDPVEMDTAAINLGDLSAVTNNINLPSLGDNGSTISWNLSNQKVISNAGVVTRPTDSDVVVTLTATVEKEGYVSRTRDFTLTVKIFVGPYLQLDMKHIINGKLIKDKIGNNDAIICGTGISVVNDETRGDVLRFNNSDWEQNGYLLLSPNMFDGISEFTISIWFNTDKDHYWQRVFDFGTNEKNYIMFTTKSNRTSSSQLSFRRGKEFELFSGPIESGKWYMVTITYKENKASIYVNGVLTDSLEDIEWTPDDIAGKNNNFIGKSQWPDDYFSGCIDDFRIYKEVLTDDQIKNLYEKNRE